MRMVDKKSPRLAGWLMARLIEPEIRLGALGDLEEQYRMTVCERGRVRAGMTYWFQILVVLPGYLRNWMYWRLVMLKNYFKVAYRNIRKSKGYSFINIAGLAVGIACCLLIMLYVLDELSYDRFYPNAGRIYRVVNYGVVNNRIDHTARSSPPVSRTLMEEFPEVEAVTKCRNYGFPVFRYGERVFSEERVFNVDGSFFDVFEIPFLQGTPETALGRPDALVLTRSMAMKYFGDEDPMGKTINSDNRTDYVVTAVIEDVPKNSHFHFDFLQSIERFDDAMSPVWVFNDYYTYMKLREGTDPNVLEGKFFEVVKERIDPFLRGVLGISVDQFFEGGGDFRFTFQPLTSIHLHSHLDFELEPNGDIVYVYVFSTVALGILLIACINFINLSTARSTMRAREVGIRKTVGSEKRQIVRQFMTETVTLTLIAVVFSCVLSYLFLPVFNLLAGKQLQLPFLTQWWGIPLYLGFAVVVGLVSGLYPAFILASYRPVDVMKGDTLPGKRRSILRTGLVVFQFMVSVVLIIGTLTVRKQLAFVQNRNLGFHKDQIVVIRKTDDLGGRLPEFKEALLQYPEILHASNSRDLIGNPVEVFAVTPEGRTEEQAQLICYMTVDADFLDTYGIRLKEGRFFEEDRVVDEWQLVLNETAVQAMGLEEPVGQRLVNSLMTENLYPVLGVVEDFHFQSLRQRIQPMVLASFSDNGVGRYLSVRIRPESIQGTMKTIKDTWQQFAAGQPFEYEFFDDHFARVYLAEEKTGRLFLTLSIVAIVIACLGLFGLSAFITDRRTKEIGVRKVLGSSLTGVAVLLVGQFTRWVLIANVIAWPVAYIAMNRWLKEFAYRAELRIGIFVLSGAVGLLIAVVTVSYQSLKAAKTDPVDSLRYE